MDQAHHTSSRASGQCSTCQFRTLRMFCNLDDAALADFSSLGHQSLYPNGTILFREDSPSVEALVLCTGQVKLSCTSKEGKTLILKIAMPGDVLGLGAVVSGSPYEVTAETVEPTEVKSIRRSEFLDFLKRHGQASLHAAQSLSADYKSAFFDARRLALSSSAAGKLAGVLLEWGRASACHSPEMRFNMALTHEDLGNLVGTSRETITRTLGRFKREKLIQMNGVRVVLLDPAALERISA